MVQKWLKYAQNLFSRPKKGPKSGFRPRKNFRPDRSKNGQNMAKSWFLGLKWVQKVVLGLEIFFVQKWPKYDKKLFSRPKEDPKSGSRPKIFFCPNWSKNVRNMAKSCFLGLKRVPKVVLGPEKIFLPIGPKIAEIWPKVVY